MANRVLRILECAILDANTCTAMPLKSAIADYEGRLRISIPLERYGLAVVVAYWLAGWTFGGISIIKQFLQKPNLFEALWICFWLVSEPVAIYILLVMIGGGDVVLADPQNLVIQREVFGLGRGKQYLLSEIRNLRFQPSAGKQSSKIAFDYVEGGEANQPDCIDTTAVQRSTNCPSSDPYASLIGASAAALPFSTC